MNGEAGGLRGDTPHFGAAACTDHRALSILDLPNETGVAFAIRRAHEERASALMGVAVSSDAEARQDSPEGFGCDGFRQGVIGADVRRERQVERIG